MRLTRHFVFAMVMSMYMPQLRGRSGVAE